MINMILFKMKIIDSNMIINMLKHNAGFHTIDENISLWRHDLSNKNGVIYLILDVSPRNI